MTQKIRVTVDLQLREDRMEEEGVDIQTITDNLVILPDDTLDGVSLFRRGEDSTSNFYIDSTGHEIRKQIISSDEGIALLNGGTVDVGPDYITLSDEHGEIVHWIDDEWKEDPTVAVSVFNALNVFHTEGPAAVRKIIGKEVDQ